MEKIIWIVFVQLQIGKGHLGDAAKMVGNEQFLDEKGLLVDGYCKLCDMRMRFFGGKDDAVTVVGIDLATLRGRNIEVSEDVAGAGEKRVGDI